MPFVLCQASVFCTICPESCRMAANIHESTRCPYWHQYSGSEFHLEFFFKMPVLTFHVLNGLVSFFILELSKLSKPMCLRSAEKSLLDRETLFFFYSALCPNSYIYTKTSSTAQTQKMHYTNLQLLLL